MRGQKRVEDARERAYDPRIPSSSGEVLQKGMDSRVKPGNDSHPMRGRNFLARNSLSYGNQLFTRWHMSAHSEAKKAKLEKPANYYDSPNDIAKDADLSADEKRQALNTWEQDARQMMTASNEGMAGDQEGLDKGDSHRLGEVVRAKEKIGAKPKHKPSQ
jgi:hypothetical protein